MMEKFNKEKKPEDLLDKIAAEYHKEKMMYGYESKFIKRHGQLDDQTVSNPNYHKSLAVGKYVLKGKAGFYDEKTTLPWHANINQTNIDKGYSNIQVKKGFF